MKTSILLLFPLALLLGTTLSSCSMGIKPDGSKSITIDTVALANALDTYNANKATK